jgi:hypothetical protein
MLQRGKPQAPKSAIFAAMRYARSLSNTLRGGVYRREGDVSGSLSNATFL